MKNLENLIEMIEIDSELEFLIQESIGELTVREYELLQEAGKLNALKNVVKKGIDPASTFLKKLSGDKKALKAINDKRQDLLKSGMRSKNDIIDQKYKIDKMKKAEFHNYKFKVEKIQDEINRRDKRIKKLDDIANTRLDQFEKTSILRPLKRRKLQKKYHKTSRFASNLVDKNRDRTPTFNNLEIDNQTKKLKSYKDNYGSDRKAILNKINDLKSQKKNIESGVSKARKQAGIAGIGAAGTAAGATLYSQKKKKEENSIKNKIKNLFK